MDTFEKEAKERWGQTQAYQEYEEKQYGKQQQKDLASGMDQMMAEFAACRGQGNAPESTEAQRLVEKLQNYISEHYYRCSNAILAGLGQMYVADDRFQSNIDRHGAGTAAFVCAAILAYVSK